MTVQYVEALTVLYIPQPNRVVLTATGKRSSTRDIDAALTLMSADVVWPRAFKGGFVRGLEEIRAYWTEQ